MRELRHQQAGGFYYPKRSQVGYAPEELPSQQTGFKQELPAAEPGMQKQEGDVYRAHELSGSWKIIDKMGALGKDSPRAVLWFY